MLVVVTTWSGGDRLGGRLRRAALALMARTLPAIWGGLRPLDPTADLARAGFVTTRRLVLARGRYPSLVLSAQPAEPGSPPPGYVPDMADRRPFPS